MIYQVSDVWLSVPCLHLLVQGMIKASHLSPSLNLLGSLGGLLGFLDYSVAGRCFVLSH